AAGTVLRRPRARRRRPRLRAVARAARRPRRPRARRVLRAPPPARADRMRVGIGYDVHRLADGRPLILGGVEIDHERGLAGHSDADVLTHAVIDALLGAAALGDIGEHFPDTDPRYEGADSIGLLTATVQLLTKSGFAPANVD